STKLPVIVKLSPNVTSVKEIARAVEEAGADAVSLINTLLGLQIDLKCRRPVLGNTMGGLSGPAVRPIAVRMVYEVYKELSIPIIGMGGIDSTEAALEMILAGASAVAVGTANFVDPFTMPKIIAGLEKYLQDHGIDNIRVLIGAAHQEGG
ncbi:MAG: dihydroorotate dehydrogenase, partial [Limnochordia bacterium]|nr:dihydroorotate dehydrogenase [Limnochordia bacterium]